ncbi:response regulator transcription factor [Pseudomonas lutea]|uniref:Response regulator transcription factor n=1 Tax=Pseudomonas lutea TaxID=243924 RepID=A0ABR9AC50_9PSED|nr:response regulator transcription factor [Pseudomonas lutea]
MSQEPYPPKSDDNPPVVFVVDDELSIRESLACLFRSVGISVETYASASEFLQREDPDAPCCLLLDVRLEGASGLDLQRQLIESNIAIPVIFITGHGDIPMSVKAMKAGALDFIVKPFRDQDLVDAVSVALRTNAARRAALYADSVVHNCYQLLTKREREIMGCATRGLMNKETARQLGLSEITVKIHRGNVMKKMHAKSFADLVRMAESLNLLSK